MHSLGSGKAVGGVVYWWQTYWNRRALLENVSECFEGGGECPTKTPSWMLSSRNNELEKESLLREALEGNLLTLCSLERHGHRGGHPGGGQPGETWPPREDNRGET